MTTVVNLEDYGLDVRPDGTYADLALNNALAASAARTTATPQGTYFGGLRIRVNGLYKLDGSLNRTLPVNTYLQGHGRTTGFVCLNDGLTLIDQAGSNFDTDSEISDLSLFSLQPDRTGILIAGGSGVRSSNCFLAGWQFGIDILDTDCATIDRIYGGGDVYGCMTSTVLRLRGDANMNHISDCRFNGWRGVDHAGGIGNTISGCNFNGPDSGVLVRSANNLGILGCNFEATTIAGVLVDNAGIAAINLTLERCMHGGGGASQAPLLKITSGSVVHGLNLIGCQKNGGVYMVEQSGLDIVGALVIGCRHYGTGPIFDNDATPHEANFYCSSAFYDASRPFTGIGTVKPTKTLEIWDGPVGLRLRDGTGVRLDLP